jgi:hypothetical protein
MLRVRPQGAHEDDANDMVAALCRMGDQRDLQVISAGP